MTPVRPNHDAAGRAGRLDGGLDDHAQEVRRVVRRRERLAEARVRLACAGALVLHLVETRLELLRHLVERRRDLCELVASAQLDTLVETALRECFRTDGETFERVDDRA